MDRASVVFGEVRFERLAGISVSHLYDLRGGKLCQNTRNWRPHRPAPRPSAEWGAGLHSHRQCASGRSGRGERGVSHHRGGRYDPVPACAICEKISEAYLLPVIRQLLDGCPSAILGLHANNGSEYINYQVAGLLERCGSSSPHHARRIPTIPHWRSPRTAESYANIWVLPRSRHTASACSMISV